LNKRNNKERVNRERQIRAVYNEKTIRVYQAYSEQIASSAVKNQTFVSPPFKMERMTWIKPSYCWMMYRAGWGDKDSNQKHILAIDITREGFEWALANSSLSSYKEYLGISHNEWKQQKESCPVRIQWDPERDVQINKLGYRSIQIGLKGLPVEKYVNEWIVSITDVTEQAKEIKSLVDVGDIETAKSLLPNEQLYTLPNSIAERVTLTV